VAVTAVFIGIYLTGLVLIGPDEPEAEADETAVADETGETVETVEVLGEDPVPYPDDEETETTQTDSDSDSDESLESSESSRS